jgi:peptidylprolyl isomerase
MAFGPYQEDMVVVVPKSRFANLEEEPEVGERLPIPQPDGPPIEVTVTEITESTVTVDANHPLAGENLSFDLELIEIVHGPH